MEEKKEVTVDILFNSADHYMITKKDNIEVAETEFWDAENLYGAICNDENFTILVDDNVLSDKECRKTFSKNLDTVKYNFDDLTNVVIQHSQCSNTYKFPEPFDINKLKLERKYIKILNNNKLAYADLSLFSYIITYDGKDADEYLVDETSTGLDSEVVWDIDGNY